MHQLKKVITAYKEVTEILKIEPNTEILAKIKSLKK